jgi:hypothetical protein
MHQDGSVLLFLLFHTLGNHLEMLIFVNQRSTVLLSDVYMAFSIWSERDAVILFALFDHHARPRRAFAGVCTVK